MKGAAILMAFALAFSTPARAFDIDYARLYDQTPDAVTEVGAHSRRLDLPGPVVVMETTASDGSKSYMGLDENPYGAVGCTFRILIEITALAAACPGTLDDDQANVLQDRLDRTATFAGANAVPAVPHSDIAARLAALVRTRTEEMQTTMSCEDKSVTESAGPFISMVTGPSFKPILDQQLAVPRLPVATPCL